MLLCLFVVTVSGLKVYAIEKGLGPLAGGTPALVYIPSAHADDDHEKDDHGENDNEHDDEDGTE